MLASLTDAPLLDPELVYEPKYDGIRAIVEIGGRVSRTAGGRPPVHLWSRLGNEKTSQFPEIVAALEQWARRRREPLILDGEIVALDARGNPTGFQQLQGRIHLGGVDTELPVGRAALIVFDVLREGDIDYRTRPFTERRRQLERIFGRTGSPLLRISEVVRGDGRALYKRALDRGWEGLIAKRAASIYISGKRTPDWRKLKIVQEQEFVIGGWTEPRKSRVYFGALIVGVYEPPAVGEPRGAGRRLTYAGHIGTGFDERELAKLMALFKPLETTECPFRERPPSNERPHWVRPALVAQVKFTEWTADGRLRHPVYLGLRDDKKPQEVHREAQARFHATTKVRLKADPTTGTGASTKVRLKADPTTGTGASTKVRLKADPTTGRSASTGVVSAFRRTSPSDDRLLEQLREIERSRRDGVVALADGKRLKVTNLHKVFWPKQKFTKGDLMRFYVQVSPFILPAIADRPLVMKRYPDGVSGQPFYQHRASDAPAGVRVESIHTAAPAEGPEGFRPQLIGGDQLTLLYMTQLASVSQDPWFSRVTTPDSADSAAFDLDPMPGIPFRRVLDVARWIRDELALIGASGVPKTSGADGLHIYIPLPPDTPYDAGLIVCQIVATVVSNKHPQAATIERSVKARGQRVYVDCLQNVRGKTLASAYSARASSYAGVSTPLTWREVDEGVDREAFTIETVPSRLRQVGDLWAVLRKSKGVDLSRVTRYAERGSTARRTRS
jgi:bifunctional non-homologous end joining protein LigD